MTENFDCKSLSELRHDLRTPLNHIIGYSEMLMEEAQDGAGPAGALPELKKIYTDGSALLSMINTDLSASRTAVVHPDLDALRGKMRPPLDRIHEACRGPLYGPPFEDDVEKIKRAAGRLGEFALSGAVEFMAKSATPEPVPAAANLTRVATPRAAVAPVAAAAISVVPGASGAVLVVDDNETNRHMLGRRLDRMGYQVTAAESGRQALDMVGTGKFDLVLLDVLMPGMNGVDVLREMKASPSLRDIPVIMLSSLDEIDSVVQCIEMGAEDYLPKVFDPVLLRARVGASFEKKKLRDRILTQEKMASLGSLTAGIAHELKNPLNFVNNFAQLSTELLEDVTRDLGENVEGVQDLLKDLEDNLEKIGEHGKRADSIIKGMLLHSRGQSGERQIVDINKLVEEAVNLAYHGLRAVHSSFNVTLVRDFDKTAGSVSASPGDLSRVFLNIVNNACYAAWERMKSFEAAFAPTVVVRTKNLGAAVEVGIRDNGKGVPAEVRDRIFQPFFTTKPTGFGTGLGLSISYDIVVNGHKGEIRLETETGQFAEFIVTLPHK